MHPHNVEVQCGSHRFRIVNGQRVWLSPPPPENLAEMMYDQARAAIWPQLMEELK